MSVLSMARSGYIWIWGGLFFAVSLFAIGKIFVLSCLIGFGARFVVWLFQLHFLGFWVAKERRELSRITGEDVSAKTKRVVNEVTESCFFWGLVLSYPLMLAYLLFKL